MAKVGEIVVPVRSVPGLITEAEIARRFNYHAPTPEKAAMHAEMRRSIGQTAQQVVDTCPPCRETSLAVTALEEAMFWANAALARPETA